MSPAPLEQPDRVGPYHVVQVIGEGGMGVVYEAEQREPVRRRVALKMMKAGMDTREVVGRFETERQSLAVMDHPGIAKVLDAGVSAEGRPWFAMELVPGVPIDHYCDLQRLTTRQRLELMIGVCEAVQHAHQKGVIHRDLKPGNILVKEEGDRAAAKVIDFGIAKAVGQRLSEQTVVTSLGQAMGTPAYMSPEQAERSGLDVDTRTDVYSLGVILHELLVDSVPVDPAEVGAQAFLLRLMQRDTPLPTLTQRLSGLDAKMLQAVAAKRRADSQRFRRELTGDLQWIVSKAVEKDRRQRYETANALAMDLRRYLANEPVVARAPSATYRLAKFARRNRAGVAAAGVALLALVTGTLGTTLGLIRARRAEARASEDAAASARVAEFLAGLFELSDPSSARGRTLSARELLDSGAARLTQELEDQPAIRARLQRTIGEVYSGLGLYGHAAPLLERALATQREQLGADHAQSVLSAYILGDVYFYQGDYARAESLFSDAAARRARVLGDEDPLTIKALGAVGATYVLQERLEDAEAILRRTLAASTRAVGADDPQTLQLLNNLQALYYRQKRYGEAEAAAIKVLAGRKRVRGIDHPEYLTAVHNLATIHSAQERFGEAERGFQEALSGRQRVLGDSHPSTLGTHEALAWMLMRQERYAEAEQAYLRIVEGFERTSGLGEAKARQAIEALVALYRAVGQPSKAAAWSARLPRPE